MNDNIIIVALMLGGLAIIAMTRKPANVASQTSYGDITSNSGADSLTQLAAAILKDNTVANSFKEAVQQGPFTYNSGGQISSKSKSFGIA